MIVATIMLGLCAAVLLLPALSDLLSLFRAALKSPRDQGSVQGRPKLLFLVPAHNEELLIDTCIRSLCAQRATNCEISIVVIADNCSDATATIAAAHGVRVLERTDTERTGKPRAIEWALNQLDYRSHDAVIIIDADAVIDPGFAEQVACVRDLRKKAVQPYNGVGNREDSALTRMGAVFATVRYEFQLKLKAAANLNLPLMGNGMCVGSDVLAERGWTAFSLCEDWEVYAQLTERGVPIEGRLAARIYSQEARSLRQSASQRRRWSAGKLSILGRVLWPIATSRKINFHQKLDAFSELLTVGPVVHVTCVAVLIAIALLLNVPGAVWVSIALAASVARLGVYTLAAIRVDPSPTRALSAFAFLPFYAVWRLVVQISALRMVGEQPWVRTQRHV